jgi:hypothetical protein
MSRRAGLAWTMLACAGLLSCSSNGGSPLGGPYGGGSYRLAPNDGGYNVVDASFSPPRAQTGAGVSGEPGTWTHIFTAYMATGTFGNCTHCHKDMSNASKSYNWLADQGYMGGTNPSLTTPGASCLSWYGGDMPTGKQPPLDIAVQEMDLWAKMGGKNN